MKKKLFTAVGLTAALLATAVTADDDNRRVFRVSADGFQETPAAVFTTGNARLRLVDRGNHFDFRLRFRNLVGNIENGAGAHIHFGRTGLNGGIMAFICGTQSVPGPVGTLSCVSDGNGNGVIEGSITEDDILAIGNQGFPGQDLEAFRTAVRNGAAYLNIHSDAFPAGEIRGDFPPRERDDD